MALSYFTESEAPRDFRISSTESESHYTKCLLCYTIKKNFFCVECIKAGNFQHSSMPYSDRFADKQAKLLRIKANRKHVQDRCETLLLSKSKNDTMRTEVKQCRDKVELIKLAIEQRRHNIEEKKNELTALRQYNTELSLKLPRYQKRVASLGKHAQVQGAELQNKLKVYTDNAESLAALRRARIRQLNKYIFPVYMTYDTSDSVEDMEFLQMDSSSEAPAPAEARERLHVVAAWLPADGDYSQHSWGSRCADSAPDGLAPAQRAGAGAGAGGGAGAGAGAALSLAAQLTTLLAWILDCRLPEPIVLSEYSLSRGAGAGAGVCALARRVCGGAVWLGVRARLPPPAPARARRAPALLHALAVAAATDDPALGRVDGWQSTRLAQAGAAWAEAWPAAPPDDPPEHLEWPPHEEMEELSASPEAPAASLVTSLASLWRGWTK